MKQPRAILPLLKARAYDITETGFKIAIGAEYGSPTTFHIVHDMRGFDLRNGDLLTIYTEALLKPLQAKEAP